MEVLDMDHRKKVHIPFCDVDDLAFRNRHDPTFVAKITNLMQVPSSITLTSGTTTMKTDIVKGNTSNYDTDPLFPMDVPDRLTVETGDILRDRDDELSHLNNQDFAFSNEFANEMMTPQQDHSINENVMDDEKLSKTPVVPIEIYKRFQKPRRTSLELDLQSEIRLLRDRVNRLEHECQINTQSNRVFYAVICGYIIVKTFSWLLKSD